MNERKMMRLAVFAVVGLILAGCQTTQEEQAQLTRLVAVIPPNTLYQCPPKPKKPDIKHLRDSQVAEYIVKLDEAHSICSRSLQAIRRFAQETKTTVESQ